MKRVTAIIITLAITLCSAGLYAVASGGAGDPLVSVSYLTGTVMPAIMAESEKNTDNKLGGLFDGLGDRVEAISGPSLSGYSYTGKFKQLSMSAGGTVKLAPFASFVPSYGTLKAMVTAGTLINLSTGEEVPGGGLLKAGSRYFAAEESYITITAYGNANGLVDGYYVFAASGQIPAGTLFVDIDGHWAANSILTLANKNYVNGVGDYKFEPDAPVTRAMFVTILGRASGISASAYASSYFSDVDAGAWYGPYVEWAAQSGIVTGYGGAFMPNDYITREQMALITVRYAAYRGKTLAPTAAEIVFTDGASIDSWAADAVKTAQMSGIITGIENSGGYAFKPLDSAQRGQMCAVIVRFLTAAGIA